MRFLPLFLLLVFCSPCFAQEEYSAPTRESYDFERLAREAALVLYVDVTAIDAERTGGMIRGGEGSVVDFRATIRESLKGEVASSDVVIRAVGHRFFQSGRLLTGPALFFVNRASGEKDGRPVYEIVDPFGKFFLKSHEADEVSEILASAERAVAFVEPVREGDPALAPPKVMRKRARPAPIPLDNPDAVEAPRAAPSPAPGIRAVGDPVGEFLSVSAPRPEPTERPVQIYEEPEEELSIMEEPSGR